MVYGRRSALSGALHAGAKVATSHGRMFARLEIRQQMPDGLVRVPHGWWKPESAKGGANLSGTWAFSDAQLSDDSDPNLMDVEQGVPHLKGIPSRVERLSAEERAELEATFGPTRDLPLGPRPEILQSDRKAPEDFMYDPQIGDGVQFRAVELSLYGKGTLN